MSTFSPNETQLQNYIQNKLSDAETEQLELWLADHPGVLEDLEMGVMFKQGVKTQPKIAKTQKLFSFFNFFTSRKLVPLHFLVYFSLGLLIFNFLNQEQNNTANYIELETVRGQNDMIYVQKNLNTVLRFYPYYEKEVYNLSITSKSTNKKIWFKNLHASQDASITVITRNDLSSEGIWIVDIFDSKDNKEQSYLIEVL